MASGLTAPTSIGSVTGAQFSTNTPTITTTAAVSPGDGIALFIAGSGITTTISSIVDSSGNTYTATTNSPATGSNRRTWIYVCPSTGTSGLPINATIRVTLSDFPAFALRAVSLRAVKASGAADKAPAAATGTSTTPSSGSTGTLAQADELELGLIVTDGVTADTFTIGGGFTVVGSLFHASANNIGVYPAYKIVTATTGDTYSATITSRAWVASVATYRAGTFPDTLRLAAIDVEYELVAGGTRALAGLLVEADIQPVITLSRATTQAQALSLVLSRSGRQTIAQAQAVALELLLIPGLIETIVSTTQAQMVAVEVLRVMPSDPGIVHAGASPTGALHAGIQASGSVHAGAQSSGNLHGGPSQQ